MRLRPEGPARIAGAFAGALLVELYLYRWALGAAVGNESLRDVRDLLGEPFSVRNPLFYLVDDLFAWGLAVAAVLLVAVLSTSLGRWSDVPPLAVGSTVLVACGAAAVAQIDFLVELNSPLDLGVLDEMRSIAMSDVADFVDGVDLGLLALGPAILFLLYALRGARGHAVRIALAVAGVGGALALARGAGGLKHPVVDAFRRHPAERLVELALRSRDEGLDRLPELSAGQQASIALRDPALVVGPDEVAGAATSTLAGAPRLPADARPSLLLYVLEGVRYDWALGDVDLPRAPMPFLRRLAAEGWDLRRHYTSSNSSARSNFSIFTGLYSPNESLFVTSSSVRVPILPRLIGFDDAFVRSPANLKGYYPLALLLNNSLDDIRYFGQLPQTAGRPRAAASINELDGLDAMVERIASTRGRPFFGAYVSWAPHQPYIDHDPDHRIYPIRPGRSRTRRYLNALHVLDRGLERVVDALEEAGHGEDTVLVVVSDHGEAFGEHGNRGHKRSVIQPALHVPVVIWAPRWLEPRVEERITSHVDLAPTLLDLLGVSFDPEAFQGESLLGDRLRRRYTFAHGSEGSFVAWDRSGYKTIWNSGEGTCSAWDLAVDPGEDTALSCEERPEILTTMQRFWLFQQRQLLRLNQLVGERWPGGAERAMSLRELEEPTVGES